MDTKLKDKKQAMPAGRQEETLKESEEMYRRGFHFGYSGASSHPKMKSYIFGNRNNTEIFNLEKSFSCLEDAKSFVEELGSRNAKILFVGTKPGIRGLVEKFANSIDMPYVSGRWLGGTLTNLKTIRKRVGSLKDLREEKEATNFSNYIKKEAVRLEKKMAKLERYFGGLQDFKNLPAALVIVDTKEEKSAVAEAQKTNIPTISLLNSDCNPEGLDYIVPGNDNTNLSVEYFLEKIAAAYADGVKKPKKEETLDEQSSSGKEEVVEKTGN